MHRMKLGFGILLLAIGLILIICDLTVWSSVGHKWDRIISSLSGVAIGFGLSLTVRAFVEHSQKSGQ
jgi:hypothetical protein